MKKIWHKLFFILKFSYRNMMSNPLRTVLLWFGFLGVSLTLFLILSMNPMMFNYYLGRVEKRYQDVDMVVEVSSTGDARFFSTADFSEDDISNILKRYDAFFEFDILATTTNSETYVHVYASTLDSLSYISNQEITQSNLLDNEVIVTKSYALDNQLRIGDEITLNASDSFKTFKVIDIIKDDFMFQGSSIFIDKQTSISFFLESLSPTLAEFPPSLLTHFYNQVYIELNDDVTYDQAYNVFQNYIGYQSLNYIETYNIEQILTETNQMTALFDVILIFVFLAIILVLSTTLQVYFHEKKKMTGVIYVLGGKPRFSMSVMMIELITLSLIGYIGGWFITQKLINFGFTYLESSQSYKLSMKDIGLSLFIFFILILIATLYQVFKDMRHHEIRMLKDEGVEKEIHIKARIVIMITIVTIYATLQIPLFTSLLGLYRTFIEMILLGLFLFQSMILIVNLISMLKVDSKTLIRHKLLFKKLLNKRQFYQYLSTTMIVFLMTFLLIFASSYMKIRINRLDDEYQFDLIVTRIISEQDQIYQEISEIDQINHADKIGYFENVETNFINESIEQVVSMDINHIKYYFNFDINQSIIERFEQLTEPQILLPIRYQKIYDQQIGDHIYIDLGPNYLDEDFIIAGFYEKQGIELAFINLYPFEAFEQIKTNSILIDTSDKQQVKDLLIDTYGQKMIVINDYVEDVIYPMTSTMAKVVNYLTLLTTFLMLSFMVTLFNHTSLLEHIIAPDNAKIYTLGLSKKHIIKHQVFTQVIIYLCSLIITILVFYGLYRIFTPLLIIFKTYEYLVLTPQMFILAIIINTLLWASIVYFQAVLVKKTEIIDYIRRF